MSTNLQLKMTYNNYKYSELTEKIILSFYKVYNTLGYGFLEKIYEKALLIELRKIGLKVDEQKCINVFYQNEVIGVYFADLIVNDSVIIEIKATGEIKKIHEIQLVNYLKASDIEVGLLINFGETPIVKRKVFSNQKFKN